ncbi:MAG TPA: outer membrane beta-barrel protein [Verrucomicrobiae bacterium]|nr:outer membrane beta-barrel protein [Verrucomicrobiae bacterium]
MNRIIASVGLVALGATSVQAQSVTAPPAKWWNVQATVRGFYDDNLNANPHPSSNDRVWGYELTPKVGVALGNEQTVFSADYKYAFLYYDHRPNGNTTHYDQDHFFNAFLSHNFNERYSLRVREAFIIGQEPDALRSDAAFHTPFRVAGDNIVNSAGGDFTAELTPLLGLEVGYNNAWYDYKDSFSQAGFSLGNSSSKNIASDGTISPSLSGALDRVDQAAHLSALWHVMPDTTASLSYEFRDVDYTANEFIGGNATDEVDAPKSQDRNVRSHTVYLGLDHKFRPDFFGSVQAGASYYDYYNVSDTSFGPYARLSLTYVYMEESSLQVGFQEGRTATDVVGGTTKGDLVHDVEASVIYGSVRQRIVPNLFANLSGSVQRSAFNGGGIYDNKSEDFYEFGANLEYLFNAHFSAHLGYDFDRLDSDIGGRSYSRNKVYIGATASY